MEAPPARESPARQFLGRTVNGSRAFRKKLMLKMIDFLSF